MNIKKVKRLFLFGQENYCKIFRTLYEMMSCHGSCFVTWIEYMDSEPAEVTNCFCWLERLTSLAYDRDHAERMMQELVDENAVVVVDGKPFNAEGDYLEEYQFTEEFMAVIREIWHSPCGCGDHRPHNYCDEYECTGN